jgi:hypothetical protein
MSRSLALEPATQPKQPRSNDQEPENLREPIELRAYELYEARGRVDGHHEDDWYQAENEIRNRDHVHQAA